MQPWAAKCCTSTSACCKTARKPTSAQLSSNRLAELDEAARLQDGSRLTKEYSRVASGFGAYAEMIPAEALS